MEEFTLTDVHLEGAWVLQVSGELDTFSAGQLREHAMRALGAASGDSSEGLVVDLTEVPFMDSAGLGICVAILRRATQQGRQVALAVTASVVVRLLEVTGVSKAYSVHHSLVEAIASTQP